MTIFTSYPMYFDALNTNMNSKNRKSNTFWPFWLENYSLAMITGFREKLPVLEPK